MREPAGCMIRCDRSSPAVNLSLPLPPPSPPKWRQDLAAAAAAAVPAVSRGLVEHTFLLHRQVVGLFNKYRI